MSRILMADRDADFVDSLSLYMKDASPDVSVEYVSNGKELVRRARNGGYSLITTANWFKEEGDGLNAIRQIREFDKEVPIYMITGSDVRNQALEAGATGFVSKDDIAADPEVYGEELSQIFKRHLSK